MALLSAPRRYGSLAELVGRTPVVRVNRARSPDMAALWAKLEGFNPSGGSKDRVALHILAQAEAEGRLRAGSVVIEATAGRMGLSLAMACAARGQRLLLVMPASTAEAWQQLVGALGAECVLTDPAEGMAGARAAAAALAAEQPDAFLVDQFANPANPDAHRHTTAQELLRDFSDLGLDGLVVPIGSGGTLSGVAPELRRRWPAIRLWAVEPAASPLLSGGEAGPHTIPGIGPAFIPPVLDRSAYDHVFPVEDRHAWDAARALARAEGLLIDPAGGAAFLAARQLARQLGPLRHVAFLCPADGRDTLSTTPPSS